MIRISNEANVQFNWNSFECNVQRTAHVEQCFHLRLHFDLCSGYLVFPSFLFYSLFSSICSLHAIRLIIWRIDSAVKIEIHFVLNTNLRLPTLNELDTRYRRKNLHSLFSPVFTFSISNSDWIRFIVNRQLSSM